MAKEFLRPIYKKVYGTEFDATSFENRMEMQKMIFLLQEAGIRVGDYDFLWYKQGLYSQGLQDDILALNNTQDADINYSIDAEEILKRLKEVFNMHVAYSRSAWVECLASLQYLKAYYYPVGTKDDVIIEDLKIRKGHLNNDELNKAALGQLDYILG